MRGHPLHNEKPWGDQHTHIERCSETHARTCTNLLNYLAS